MRIIVAGDIHAKWGHLQTLIEAQQPDIILQCGDFGYWPRQARAKPVAAPSRIYWCDGNHEDFTALEARTSNEVYPYIYYQPRGSSLQIKSTHILFMGGADSIDKKYRTPGYDWFPEELITYRDVTELLEKQIDIIISHTYPMCFGENAVPGLNLAKKRHDPSRHALDIVYEKYKPKYWFFAHWHCSVQGQYQDCKWTCLNMAPRSNWWTNISKIIK